MTLTRCSEHSPHAYYASNYLIMMVNRNGREQSKKKCVCVCGGIKKILNHTSTLRSVNSSQPIVSTVPC